IRFWMPDAECWTLLVVLEVLDLTLVLPGRFERVERPEVPPTARARVGLPRVDPVRSAFHFSDHIGLSRNAPGRSRPIKERSAGRAGPGAPPGSDLAVGGTASGSGLRDKIPAARKGVMKAA